MPTNVLHRPKQATYTDYLENEGGGKNEIKMELLRSHTTVTADLLSILGINRAEQLFIERQMRINELPVNIS